MAKRNAQARSGHKRWKCRRLSRIEAGGECSPHSAGFYVTGGWLAGSLSSSSSSTRAASDFSILVADRADDVHTTRHRPPGSAPACLLHAARSPFSSQPRPRWFLPRFDCSNPLTPGRSAPSAPHGLVPAATCASALPPNACLSWEMSARSHFAS